MVSPIMSLKRDTMTRFRYSSKRLRGVDPLGPDQLVDKEQRLEHADVEYPEGTESNEPQFFVTKSHRIASPPFEVGEDLQIDKVHFGPQTDW